MKFTLVFYKISKALGPFLTRRLLGFYSGTGMSYFAGYFFAGRETNQQGILPSVIFNFSQWQVHLHHWLLSLIFLAILVFPLFLTKKINTTMFLFVFGFSFGLILQGVISYSDWNEIITKRLI